MKSRSHFTPYYYLVAGVLLQGLSPVFTKLLLPDLSYATVVAARYVLAVGFLLPFGYHHRTVPQAPGKPTRRDWVALFFVGALGSGLGALLFTAALDHSHAGIVNAISKTAPIFVAFFAYLTLRERITWGRVMLVLMMVVADVLIGVGELSLGTAAARQYLVGDALALGAGITRAIAEILGKGALRKFAPATVAMWRFGIGCLITGTIAVGTGEYMGLMQLSSQGWIILLVLAGVSTSLSMGLYYRGLAEIPAHVAVTLKLLGAIVTAVVSWIVLNEALNAYHIAGMAVLVFGAYLIVMRTASQQAETVPDEPEGAASVRPWTSSLRNRIAMLVAAAIIVTVLSGTYLAIRHSRSVISEQAQLSMIETGYMILQYQTLGKTLEPGMYERLLQRLTRHKIRGRVYSVDIVYVLLLDGEGDVIAFAADPDIQNLTEEGKFLKPERSVLGRELLRFVNSENIDEYPDIQPMNIELEGYPQLLKMGYRRSITGRVASEISARYFTLAVLLIIVGILVTIYFVGRLIRPLEKLTVAVGRIAAGDYEVPVLSAGTDEFDSLSHSMSRIVEDLQVAAMVRKSMFRSAVGTQQTFEPAALPPVLLVTDSPRSREAEIELSEDEVAAYTNAIIAAVSEHEGEFFSHRAGRSVAAWGQPQPERDDALRAVIAGLQIVNFIRTNDLSAPLEHTRLVVDFRPQQTIDEMLQGLDEATGEVDDKAQLYLTPQAYREVQRHVSAKSIADGAFFEVLSLGENEAMTQIAASPDE